MYQSLTDLIEKMYGASPRAPEHVAVTLLHQQASRELQLHNAVFECYRVTWEHGGFTLYLVRLKDKHSSRVLVTGDGCWQHVTDPAVHRLAIGHGVALAWFNRCEVAPDPPTVKASMALVQSQTFGSYGAIALWAFALSRAVDALCQLPWVDAQGIGLSGHSRGGKAALLAGATDRRIAFTHANNAGCAGAATERVQTPGCETLSQLARQFPHWLAPRWAANPSALDEQGFDQAQLLMAHAPRHLLITQAIDDHWANPGGTHAAVESAKKACVDNAIDPSRVQLVSRNGGHAMTREDWRCAFDALARLT